MARFNHINARAEARILGLLAIALALFAFTTQYVWHDMPAALAYAALALALFCACWAIWDLLPPAIKPWASRLGPKLLAAGLISAGLGISFAWYREQQRISDHDLTNAYLLIGKSDEIKKKCALQGIPDHIFVYSDGEPLSNDFIDTLTTAWSPNIVIHKVKFPANETIEPGISLFVQSINVGESSYGSVKWITCLNDIGITLKIRERQPNRDKRTGPELGINIKR